MIIFKCIFSGDEMFTDAYNFAVTDDGCFYEVEGKMVSRVDKFDDRLIGANASAEDAAEQTDAYCATGVDLVLGSSLAATPPYSKKEYVAYVKCYLKSLEARLQRDHPDRVAAFKLAAGKGVKRILSDFKNFEFYKGESMHEEGLVALLNFREDGVTPYMLFFKDGLEQEKF
ncbi:translationally-controlled tumor protein homolog [Brachionichthys hirsutus]|uniref:translationally-controlled tumor protein homolog n=1 Tax=Brachionichthys hirsutus TaxID=412623 RepID=UPI003604DE4E